MVKKQTLFSVLFVLLNLHLLRNVSFVGYVSVLSFLFFAGLVYSLPRFLSIQSGAAECFLLFFLATSIWPAIVTFLDYGPVAGVYAMGRYFLTIPMAVVAVSLIRQDGDIEGVLWMFCIIVGLGLATIPLQYVIGPISWFAEPGYRANTVRYSSMLGSLTVAGNVVGFAILIVLALLDTSIKKVFLVSALVLGGLLTLQKAALMGIPLAVALYLFIRRRSVSMKTRPKTSAFRRLLIVGAAGLLVAGVPIVKTAVPELKQAVAYLVANLASDDAYAASQDFTIADSMAMRLVSMPRERIRDLFEFKGPFGIVFGGGFGMVGTSLVREEDGAFVTSHNGYVDLFLIGGLLHLTAFLGLVWSVMRVFTRWAQFCGQTGRSDRVPFVLLGVLYLGLIGFCFSGLLTYQPNISCLFWLAVGCSIHFERRLAGIDVPRRRAVSPVSRMSRPLEISGVGVERPLPPCA